MAHDINTLIADDRLHLRKLQRELSERKRLEKEHKDLSMLLQRLMDAIPNPVFYKDISGAFLGCNTAFERILEQERKAIIGKTVFDLLPEHRATPHASADNEVVRSGRETTYETTVRRNDGDVRQMICTKAVYADAEGGQPGIYAFRILGLNGEVRWLENNAVNIVRQHGGTIDVQSRVDKGTVFTVRLPIHPPQALGSPTG